MSSSAIETEPKPPRLIDQVCTAIRVHGYRQRSEKAYVGWIRRYVRFHRTRHPVELGEAEVSATFRIWQWSERSARRLRTRR